MSSEARNQRGSAPSRGALPGALVLTLLALACSAGRRAAPPGPAGSATPATVRIGAIDWYADYGQALELGRARRMALWVHFGENPG